MPRLPARVTPGVLRRLPGSARVCGHSLPRRSAGSGLRVPGWALCDQGTPTLRTPAGARAARGRWLQAGRAAQPGGCSVLSAPRGVLKAERRSESLRVCWHPVVPPRGLRRAQSPPSVSRLLGLPRGEPFRGMDVASAGRCELLAAAAAFGWWPSVCAVRPLLSGSSS